MRKSPQKEAAERRAAQKHEQELSDARGHLRELRNTIRNRRLNTSEGRKSREVLYKEICRLVTEHEVYNEAAAEIFIEDIRNEPKNLPDSKDVQDAESQVWTRE